jgi:membrane-bound metal-dependent hydrolase YbcI (DUF457 family)
MFFFFHLAVGAVLGVLLAGWRGDKRLFYAAILGSGLPDFIDKPLGELVLADSIGYGRIYFHSLLFLCILAIAALLLYRTRWSAPLLALAGGVGLHQVFDEMWHEPVNWLWPLFGPSFSHDYSGNLLENILSEITNPSEWIFFLAVSILILLALEGKSNAAVRRFISPIAPFLPLALGAFAVIAFLAGMRILPVAITGLSKRSDNLFLAAGTLVAAIVLALQQRWIRGGKP